MRDDPPSTGRLAASLLSARFDEWLTPRLLPAAYQAVLIGAPVVGIAAIVDAWLAGWQLGLLSLLVVPAVLLGVIVGTRVACELALATLVMAEDVASVAERLPRLESSVDDVANEMPRLGFLRLLSGGPMASRRSG
jgi:hypothetical protein